MPKNLITIIVYNRFDNLKRWLECWDKCDKTDAELVVIHNYDKKDSRYLNLCMNHGVVYIPRVNEGMDIGAFRDLCHGKYDLDYEKLIWITDDTIPMSKDFVKQFEEPLKDKVGLTCMEISNKRSPLHVRTTGFCISKETASKLTFPEKIVTKEDCYQFEHRGKNTLMLQVKKMGLECIQIAYLDKSPLWDTGNRGYLNRWEEHDEVFNSVTDTKDKVVFICPVYNTFPEIVSSLICQTHKNWELLFVHDGPNSIKLELKIEALNDPRIKFIETPEHRGNWGHYIRQEYLQKFVGDYVVITNADNYHVPVYIERMLAGFTSDNIVATYCSAMVHSYTNWGVIPCQLKRGYIDCAGVMVRAEVAKSVGWSDIESHSSDWTYFLEIIKKYGTGSFKVVKGTLLIHN